MYRFSTVLVALSFTILELGVRWKESIFYKTARAESLDLRSGGQYGVARKFTGSVTSPPTYTRLPYSAPRRPSPPLHFK
jgi:hypothetical protein